jgi:hypothetical protein
MKCQENNDIGCIKGELKFENYLDILEDKDKFALCRFRTTNQTTGRSGEKEKNY